MANTLLDKFKRFIAPFFFPAAVVDDDPPTLADGDTPLFRAHKTNRGVYVHVANAADISGGGGGGGEVTQGDGSGTEAGFWTVRVSDGSGFIPFPAALDGSRFAVASVLTDGTNDAVITNSTPSGSAYGLAVRHVGSVNVSPALQTAGSYFSIRITTDGANFAPLTTLAAGAAIPTNPPATAAWLMGRTNTAGTFGIGYPIRVETTGSVYVLDTNAPITGATEHVWTRVPAGNDMLAGTSGIAIVRGTAGRYKRLVIQLTSASPVFFCVHNAATATAPAAANRMEFPRSLSQYEEWELEPDAPEAFTAGLKVVAWTDRAMTTIAAAATFEVHGRVV